MNDSLYIAATSLHAQQLNIDTVANNLANVNTPGFKKARVGFQELMSRQAVGSQGPGVESDSALRLGSGVLATSSVRSFATAELKATGDPLDVAIRGDGLIEIGHGWPPGQGRATARNAPKSTLA